MQNFTEFKQYKQLKMRTLKKRKLTKTEQKLLQELANSQEVKLGQPKHEKLSVSDMPLFKVNNLELF
jgi:hypothetical protein